MRAIHSPPIKDTRPVRHLSRKARAIHQSRPDRQHAGLHASPHQLYSTDSLPPLLKVKRLPFLLGLHVPQLLTLARLGAFFITFLLFIIGYGYTVRYLTGTSALFVPLCCAVGDSRKTAKCTIKHPTAMGWHSGRKQPAHHYSRTIFFLFSRPLFFALTTETLTLKSDEFSLVLVKPRPLPMSHDAPPMLGTF